MKTRHLSFVLFAIAAFSLTGCGQSPDDQSSESSSLADTITQKNKIEAGMKARDQIQAVSEQEKKEREEAYDLTK